MQEFEIDVECAYPAEPESEESAPVEVPVELREGLVGDAVGYTLQIPVFADYAAAETMNAFYLELVDGMESYVRKYVNEACLQRNCIASVYGEVTGAVLTGSLLEVDYECRVEFSDTEEPTVNSRSDVWNVDTGEVKSETT